MFIGLNGSRKAPHANLWKFLNEDEYPWVAEIRGGYRIGKSEMIKYICEEARKVGKQIIELHQEYDAVTLHTSSEPLRLFNSKDLTRDVKNAILDYKHRWDTLRNGKELVLLWHIDPEVEIADSDLLAILTECGNVIKTRVILERRKFSKSEENGKPKKESGKPIMMRPGGEKRRSSPEGYVQVPPFQDSERDEFILTRIKTKVIQEESTMPDAILTDGSPSTALKNDLLFEMCKIVRGLCGQHPGLLDLLCKLIMNANVDYNKYYHDGKLPKCIEDELIDMNVDECCSEVDRLIESMSPSARDAIKEKRVHLELMHNGLVVEEEELGSLAKILFICDEPHKRKAHSYRRFLGGTARKEPQYHVFICHASKDKQIVNRIIRAFKREGVTYWVDHEQIRPVDDITPKIEEGLKESRFIMFCLSKNSIPSKWCRAEYGAILNQELANRNAERRIVVLRIDKVSDNKIPKLLRDRNRIEYSMNAAFKELMEFLKSGN